MTQLSELTDPVAVELLSSTEPAHLAYAGLDGFPRTVPIWFHWTGSEVVLGTPQGAPKVRALQTNPRVAVSIDSKPWPSHCLLLRGTATVEMVEGMVPEYALAAQRYLGAEQGRGWAQQVEQMGVPMARVTIRPSWSAVIDFETRWPSAIAPYLSASA
jgi:hypothetical protein